jgi:RNA polymerase sigma-70 factor, ECF subfamily
MTRFDAPEFLLLLRDGDSKAHADLFRNLRERLLRTAIPIVGSRAQAEDVVQDSMLVVLSSIRTYEGRGSLINWIRIIVQNRARTQVRREKRWVSLPGFVGAADVPGSRRNIIDETLLCDTLNPERTLTGKQALRLTLQEIEHMPAPQRAIIKLRGLEGHGVDEASKQVGISMPNQRVLLHRARSRLRQRLTARYNGGPSENHPLQPFTASRPTRG